MNGPSVKCRKRFLEIDLVTSDHGNPERSAGQPLTELGQPGLGLGWRWVLAAFPVPCIRCAGHEELKAMRGFLDGPGADGGRGHDSGREAELAAGLL
jgi:hypothetical protein